MDQLSCILLHVDLVNPHFLLTGRCLDLHETVVTDGEVELGDLIILGIVGIKIVFPVKPAVLVDFTVDRQPHRQGVFHHLSVQNRKRPRHSGADRAGVGVGCSAEFRRAGTENLCFRGKLHVDLQPYDCLILSAHLLRLLSGRHDGLYCHRLSRFRYCTRRHFIRTASLKRVTGADDILFLKTVSDQLKADGESS